MHLILRVDGGAEIGYGHFVRTGALAETVLKDEHAVTCASTTPDAAESVYPDAVDILALDPATERERFPEWVQEEQPEVVLTDSYEIDAEYQRRLDSCSSSLAVILDDTRHTICADMLINGNVYARDLEYDYDGKEPRWCLGLDYLLLRQAIRTWAAQSSPWRDPPGRALLTMGGSDVRGTTPKVLPAFEGTNLTVDVIIGPGFSTETVDKIEQVAAMTDTTVRLLHDPPDLAKRMYEADLAVSATGSTSYELLALGTPTIGIPQADNQIPIAEGLGKRDAMVHLSPMHIDELGKEIKKLTANNERRRLLRDNGRKLIDARGSERVYRALEKFSSS